MGGLRAEVAFGCFICCLFPLDTEEDEHDEPWQPYRQDVSSRRPKEPVRIDLRMLGLFVRFTTTKMTMNEEDKKPQWL